MGKSWTLGGNVDGLFTGAGNALNKGFNKLLDPKAGKTSVGRWVGKNFLMVGEEDAFLKTGIAILNGTKTPDKFGLLNWWKALHIIPAPIRPYIGQLAEHIQTQVPILKDLPTYFKFNAIFGTFGIALGAITGAFKGFTQTQGDLGDKAAGALSQSAQQAGRSAGILAATSTAALFIPKLLFGLSGGGAAMVLTGMLASSVAEKFAGQFFDKALPKTSENPQQALEAKAQAHAAPVSHTGADMVRFMEQLDHSSKLSAQAHNPFIEAIPGSKMAMNDADWTKLMKAAS